MFDHFLFTTIFCDSHEIQALTLSIKDPFYKVNAEALGCVSVLMTIVRPSVAEPLQQDCLCEQLPRIQSN